MLTLHSNTAHYPSGQFGVLTDYLGASYYMFASRTGTHFTVKSEECVQAEQVEHEPAA